MHVAPLGLWYVAPLGHPPQRHSMPGAGTRSVESPWRAIRCMSPRWGYGMIGFDKLLYSCIIQLLNGCMEQLMTQNEVQAQVFQEQLMQFVRGLGLHRSDATPCGFPVSLAEACALVALTHNEPLSQRELVQALNLEKSTVSRLVVELIDRGWVVRERDTHDARVQLMRRTPAGVTASDAIVQARNQRFGELLGRIEPSRRQQVVDAMIVLAEAVSDDSMATN